MFTSIFNNRYPIIKIICFLAAFLFTMCRKDKVSTDSAYQLLFSVDTVQFDTIFTTLGSATKRLMVYNPNKQAIRTSIALEEASSSPFRINIDGVENAHHVEIAAKDSLYIFVEVTIDPKNSDLPVVTNGYILFETNTNHQKVCLEAYGQDVHIFNNDTLQSQTWAGTKPYLIYGQLVVDTLQVLRIGAGVHVYLHKNADIHVKGTLLAEGETNNRIIFSGNRLETQYNAIPGQWGSIIFAPGSQDNMIQNVEIRNGTNGLVLGKPNNEIATVVTLDAVTITNMAHSGLLAFTADINASNCLVTNCTSYTVGLFCGGTYNFTHCTIANNYSSYIRRKAIAALTVSDNYGNISGKTPVKATFGNTLVFGTMNNEITLDETSTCLFDHCLLRTASNISDNPLFLNVINNKDPQFVAPRNEIFYLDETSPARNNGKYSIAVTVPFDMDGYSRTTDKGADIGAYEWVPERE